MEITNLMGQTQTEVQKKKEREKTAELIQSFSTNAGLTELARNNFKELMFNPAKEAEKALIGASSYVHLLKYVPLTKEEIEQEELNRRVSESMQSEREQQERIAREREAHKQMLIDVQVKAARIIEDEKLAQQGNEQVNDCAGKGSNAGIESKQLNQSDNDFKFSGLLNMPNGKDDWFEVIDAMTKDYYLVLNNLMPTKAQAWVRLCENPPTGYGITASKDNLSITMIGIVKPFNKRSFDRRWAKYTAKSNQI